MKCQCVVRLSFSYTWADFQIELLASGLSLSSESQSNAADKRLLDILRQGLATEFPNPERIGCPGNALLKGIAQGKVSLTEVEPWLDHLGSCSPCFQEFKEFRRQSAMQRRRVLTWVVATAAVLLLAFGGWLWVRGRHSVEATDTAVLDLRERSVARGESQADVVQAPLEIPRSTKHLILDLPIGSKEGPYDIALFTGTGDELLRATGIAELHDHITDLRVDVGLSRIQPGTYSLGVRQPGLEWTRYPVRLF
jgi:hypothetical protein